MSKRASRRHNRRKLTKKNSKRIRTENVMYNHHKPPLEMNGGVPSWFKKMMGRVRRAKVKQAMRTGKEVPLFRKSDTWEWW